MLSDIGGSRTLPGALRAKGLQPAEAICASVTLASPSPAIRSRGSYRFPRIGASSGVRCAPQGGEPREVRRFMHRPDTQVGWPTLVWLALLVVLLGQVFHLGLKLGKWAAFIAFCRLIGATGMIIPASMVVMSQALFGPSEDGFASGLVIPSGLHTDEPLPENAAFGDAVEDTVGERWRTALSDSRPRGVKAIDTSMPSLGELSGSQRALLLRHLCSSAQWRVFREDGHLVATRRLAPDGHWRWTLHGYYANGQWDGGWDGPSFQFRVTLGLEGYPGWAGDSQTVTANQGENVNVSGRFERGGSGLGSHLLVNEPGAVLEIMEQSPSAERILTPLVIADVEAELAGVLRSPVAKQDGIDRSLLPPGSTRRGQAEIVLQRSVQGGIYNVYAFANPGEPGTVYLKAWEVSRNVRLSEDRLTAASNENIGWSPEKDEQFFYNTEVTIFEGDPGQFYAARFELWFKPDSGKPERKLAERIFRIDGWMR